MGVHRSVGTSSSDRKNSPRQANQASSSFKWENWGVLSLLGRNSR